LSFGALIDNARGCRTENCSDEHDGENETILGEKRGLPHICRPNDYRIFGLSAISLGSQSI